MMGAHYRGEDFPINGVEVNFNADCQVPLPRSSVRPCPAHWVPPCCILHFQTACQESQVNASDGVPYVSGTMVWTLFDYLGFASLARRDVPYPPQRPGQFHGTPLLFVLVLL
jgi:hypothetical protein